MSSRDEALASRVDMDVFSNRLDATKTNNLRSVMNSGFAGPVPGGAPVVEPRIENPLTIQDSIDETHAIEQMATAKKEEVARRITQSQKLLIIGVVGFFLFK